MTENINNESIDSAVKNFTSFMYEKGCQSFGTKCVHTHDLNPEANYARNEWFDKQCQEAKTEFKTARNTFLRHKNDPNRLHFVKTRTKYNHVKRRAKFKYQQKEGENISNMAKTAPKSFWKEIKKKYKKKAKKSNSLTVDDFLNHLRKCTVTQT
ncbi:MAG: hypothetical protein N0E48_03045, partial [Candidatus Thiodiazotropha endolucinida]|nr:hypothetical protein [Candidatus Thiodiazotropha taylori]MCW4342339.1 hypothetical protein [Candidatus Thiodiazotropha endolucinida]